MGFLGWFWEVFVGCELDFCGGFWVLVGGFWGFQTCAFGGEGEEDRGGVEDCGGFGWAVEICGEEDRAIGRWDGLQLQCC